MAEIDVTKATADPEDLTLSTPEETDVDPKLFSRAFSGQMWAMMQSLHFIMAQESDLRDNDVMSDIIASTLGPTEEIPSTTDLDAFYEESEERREDISLEPVDETTYKRQRDTRQLKDFSFEMLVAMGIEQELGEDTTEAEGDDETVRLSDDTVEESVGEGTDPEIKSTAEAIASDLDMETTDPLAGNQNLIIEDPYVLDSTDPYVKKVRG